MFEARSLGGIKSGYTYVSIIFQIIGVSHLSFNFDSKLMFMFILHAISKKKKDLPSTQPDMGSTNTNQGPSHLDSVVH